MSAAGGGEQKRATDIENRAPFSPYNLRLYRQTYYGIRDVLHPLVQNGQVCVLPMQSAQPGKLWLLEICPASTLKKLNLYLPYKGRTESHRRNRRHIVSTLAKIGELCVPSGLRRRLADEPNGDVLDSVVAAYAAFQAIRHTAFFVGETTAPYLVEGFIFA